MYAGPQARSSTIGPYSTSTPPSPSRRTVTAVSSLPVNRVSTPSSSSAAVEITSGREARRPALMVPSDGARSARTGTNRTVSPGAICPSFQRSPRTTVTGQTNPPRLGPSGPSRIGVSPVKSKAPTQ